MTGVSIRTLPNKPPLNPPNRWTKQGRSPGPPYVRHGTACPFSPAIDVKVPHSCTARPIRSAVLGTPAVRLTRKKIANVETATRFITLPRLFRSRFVDESRQGLDLIFFQFQIRHLRRFDTRIGEKFFQIVLLE